MIYSSASLFLFRFFFIQFAPAKINISAFEWTVFVISQVEIVLTVLLTCAPVLYKEWAGVKSFTHRIMSKYGLVKSSEQSVPSTSPRDTAHKARHEVYHIPLHSEEVLLESVTNKHNLSSDVESSGG
jgi:hypothetical protein